MATSLISSISIFPRNHNKTLPFGIRKNLRSFDNIRLKTIDVDLYSSSYQKRLSSICSGMDLSSVASETRNYEFCDAGMEVEFRLNTTSINIQRTKDIFVDTDETSLLIRAKVDGTLLTLFECSCLFDRIKPGETIWYLDEEQLVISLKKYDRELKWPDIMESWDSLKTGCMQLLKGSSIYIVGDSTEMNQEVAKELAVGIGYTPLNTRELLESYAQQSIDSWMIAEGADSIAEAESTVLEGLSSHVRTVVATLGDRYGAASRHDKWQHLYAGFSVWLSKSEAADETSAKDEARRNVEEGNYAYSNADVVVKLSEWDKEHSTLVAQACLSALKQLILSDKQLTGKKSLYIRLGCRGDWPNIKPPGWDPSTEANPAL